MSVDVRAVAEAMYEAEIAKDFDTWFDLFHDDVVISFPLGRDPDALRVSGKPAWGAITRQKFVDRQRTRLERDTWASADGRRAFNSLRVSIDFADGRTMSDLPLVMVLTIDDDGLITTVDEYVNEAFFEE